jgi:preprotein translocase subunit SecY
MLTELEIQSGTADEGISTLVHRAVEDARELAHAEVALYKAKASERIAAYTSAATFFGAAAVLALSAVTALLVGLIMALSTLIGPLGATGVVVVVTLAIAGVLAMIGKGKLAPAGGKK